VGGGYGSQGDYFIAVQVEDLIHSFRQGVQVFLADLESNRSKAAAAYAKAGAFLTHLSAEKGSNFASKTQEILETAERTK
jgi:hypothetical protein